MKIVLILITAGVIDEHNNNKLTESYEMDFSLFMNVAKWAVPPILLILAQPDTGVVLIIAISLVAMIVCSGIKTMVCHHRYPDCHCAGIILLYVLLSFQCSE